MAEDAFPDVRWGSDPGPLLRQPIEAFISSRMGAWLIRQLTPVDRWLLRHSDGHLTIFGPIGAPLLLLTTTGKKTGHLHETSLAYMRDGDRLFLVGVNFGKSKHPDWSTNLLGDPNASVTMGGQLIPVIATQVIGMERERILRMFGDYARNFDVYHNRSHRDVRVFALTRR
ncbi:MAG TPA: nitroreductase/quinone reductase family protein [Mycobacterium sp.]|nr:nitroreductase/quinone reductase family protein [Mycobacterium sp.]